MASAVDLLPEQLKKIINGALRNGVTIDRARDLLADALAELDEEIAADITVPSRSAIGRHKQKLERIMRKYNDAKAIAEAAVAAFGEIDDDKLARLNVHMMEGAVQDIITAQTENRTLTPAEAAHVARTLEALSRTKKNDNELVERLRAQCKAEAEAAMRAKLEAMLPKGERDPSEMTDEELDQALFDAISK